MCQAFDQNKSHWVNWGLAILLSLLFSTLSLSWWLFNTKVIDIALAKEIFWQYQLIIWCAAVIVGGALGMSGAVLQVVLRNPLADVSILGILSGSQFVGLLLLFILPSYISRLSYYSYALFLTACVIGAMLVLLLFMLVIFTQKSLTNITVIIFLGVGISAVFSALTALIMSFSRAETLQQITLWQFGGFLNVSWLQLTLLILVSCVFFAFAIKNHQAFDMLSLGETEAMLMGVDVKRLLVWLVITLAFLVACIVSIAGPIAFLGLAAPHIARFLLSTNKMKVLLIASFLCGASLMLISQWLSQSIAYPMIIPVGIITALLGAPFLVFLVIRELKTNGV
ncbi:FecCD family ABC transporter permease [Fastidiosibacter lacustris]|uniref:FecCD family ABC transporter permease n=1 Tax=Fastidiosibacter lacustris TaxID=2056695 RepID=UPI0013009E04|nr:iron ABC transporter permease [Fastidiosibacter lacustris]